MSPLWQASAMRPGSNFPRPREASNRGRRAANDWHVRRANLPAVGLFFTNDLGDPGVLVVEDPALVQAFVNTREAERGWEALANPDSLRSWLRRRGLLADGVPVGEGDVGRAREVREALRALLAANNGAEVGGENIRALNRAAEGAGLGLRFEEGGRAALSPVAGGVDGALAGCWPSSTPGWRRARGIA